MPKKLTTEEFINKARAIHGDRYDYSKVVYINSSTNIIIICREHGEFFKIPSDHINKKAAGCVKCTGLNKRSTHEVIDDFISIHGELYNYDNVMYINDHTKVCIVCKKCNTIFWQKANTHKSGCGCPTCFGTKRKTTLECVNDFRKKHGDRYDYSKVVYGRNARDKVLILCHHHKNVVEFYQTPHSHLNGSGCPSCRLSMGENDVGELLTMMGEFFLPQYKFEGCKDKRELPVDFYLPGRNLVIEYDGEQHTSPWRLKNKEKALRMLETTQRHDKIKNDYFNINNIKILRITHVDRKNGKLKSLISETLSNHSPVLHDLLDLHDDITIG